MQTFNIILTVALTIPFTFALPQAPAAQPVDKRATVEPKFVTSIPSNYTDVSQLPHVPKTLDSTDLDLLNKFQTYSNKAATALGASLEGEKFPGNGWCYAESPCRSLTAPATAEIPKTDSSDIALPKLSSTEIEKLLDQILSNPNTGLSQSPIFTHLTQLNLATNGVELTVYGTVDSAESTILAGAVWDLYKVHADDTATNAVRAVQAESKIAICLTPIGADEAAAMNFCAGKELDGRTSTTTTSGNGGLKKRGEAACGLLAFIPIMGIIASAMCSSM